MLYLETMKQKRVFKTRAFAQWAKKLISDDLLCAAAREIEKGQFEADLGGGLCKKRVATPGQGKSGALRTLVAKRHAQALFFVTGRSKSDPGTDFSPKEEAAAKIVGGVLQKADVEKLNQMKTDGALTEICNDKENC